MASTTMNTPYILIILITAVVNIAIAVHVYRKG